MILLAVSGLQAFGQMPPSMFDESGDQARREENRALRVFGLQSGPPTGALSSLPGGDLFAGQSPKRGETARFKIAALADAQIHTEEAITHLTQRLDALIERLDRDGDSP